jgi:hypothetical protein
LDHRRHPKPPLAALADGEGHNAPCPQASEASLVCATVIVASKPRRKQLAQERKVERARTARLRRRARQR